jgi:hypothetical protein
MKRLLKNLITIGNFYDCAGIHNIDPVTCFTCYAK